MEDYEKNPSKSKQTHRSALFDITNDSPIAGLATGSPSSMIAKRKKRKFKGTPGSGERLLRFQAKTLLQKTEEEAKLTKISSLETRHFIRLVNSSMALLAPTPTNTPQLANSNLGDNGMKIVIASPVVEEHLRATSQVVSGILKENKDESFESQESVNITRSLLFDFSYNSDPSDSTVSSQFLSKEISPSTPAEDASSLLWSMLVNTSIGEEEDEEIRSYEEDVVKEEISEEEKHCQEIGKMILRENISDSFRMKKEESSSGLLRLK